MTIADAVLVALFVLLLLVLLGVMREVLILRGHVAALAQLITHPPAPSYLGQPLPGAVASRLEFNSRAETGMPLILLYLSKGCSGCDGLIRDLRQAVALGRLSAAAVTCIVRAGAEQDETYQAAEAIGCRMIVDRDGKLYDFLEIRGTPTQMALWNDTAEVFAYHIGGDVQWMLDKLAERRDLMIRVPPMAERQATST
ncbi:MAG: hypothetical protein ACR2GA_06585 [Chloroflexota bacterium]